MALSLSISALVFPFVNGFRELLRIQPQFLRIPDQAVPVQLRGTLDQQIMHLPVFSLVAGSKRRFGRDVGIIAVFIGIVLDHQADLALVDIHDLFDGRTGRHAVRSLEIDELYDRDRSISRPEGRG